MNENKSYQLTCLFLSSLDQGKIDEIIQKIKGLITVENGSISETTEPIKKNLAYPIKKQLEAFYWSSSFLLSDQKINEFRQQLDLEKNILRYLINIKKTETDPIKKETIKKPLNEMIDKIEPLKEMPLGEMAKKPIEKEISSDTKKKVKIEELDKKLEEILNQ
ncbi:MAG: 30S ribosomal protein S6 [Candidatus Portnoybacteria bacterium]|nr:30S ribosomal protein S6 [Candidatus Portnoybacteria bacterium]